MFKSNKYYNEENHISLRKFTRRIENFTCEVCKKEVIGNGYTNHCSKCLHSKHVDINPGDRASSCKGIMKSIARGYQKKKGDIILQECIKCGHQKKNKISIDDNMDEICKLPLF